MRCLKISMAGKPHYLELLQAFPEPIADSGSTKIVEFTFFDACFAQDLVEVPSEVGNYFYSGVRICPIVFGTKLALYVIVPGGRYKNVWVTLGLPALVINQKLSEHIGQRQSPAICVLDSPLPRLGSIRFRRDLYRLLIKIDIAPCTVQEFASAQSG